MTEAVAVAVHHELQRLEDDRTRYLQRVREAATRVRAVSPPPVWLTDADLYDAYFTDAGHPFHGKAAGEFSRRRQRISGWGVLGRSAATQ